MPVAQLLSDFAEQGLTRKAASKALGVTPMTLYRWMSDADCDPFPAQGVASEWVRDTGVPLGEELARLAAAGISKAAAARAIGYRDNRGLDGLLASRKLHVHFDTRSKLDKYRDSLTIPLEADIPRFSSLAEAARTIGYETHTGLCVALKAKRILPPTFRYRSMLDDYCEAKSLTTEAALACFRTLTDAARAFGYARVDCLIALLKKRGIPYRNPGNQLKIWSMQCQINPELWSTKNASSIAEPT